MGPGRSAGSPGPAEVRDLQVVDGRGRPAAHLDYHPHLRPLLGEHEPWPEGLPGIALGVRRPRREPDLRRGYAPDADEELAPGVQ